MIPYYNDATRAQVISLKAFTKLNPSEITEITGIPERTCREIYKKAQTRGFNPEARPAPILDEYVKTAQKPSVPTKQTEEVIIKVLSKIRHDHFGHKKTCAYITSELTNTISAITVWRILWKAGLKKTKPTHKPDLTEKMRRERYNWCLKHKDWTLEDWKRVI
jgi:hypothetical protein